LSIVDALGIPVLSVPGVEADDVVGTLAAKAQQDGFGSVVIVSTDKVSTVPTSTLLTSRMSSSAAAARLLVGF
jgi:DNA polymerase-1